MNIISFDTEEWFIEKNFKGDRQYRYPMFDNMLEQILLLLQQQHIKATFFCVGQLATQFPQVIKKIDNAGHEIGCHSNIHQWLNKMNQQQVAQDTKEAIDALQQLIGKKIKSYRAPAFSIGKDNQSALQILAQNGIERDASVFPTARDFGGFREFQSQLPTIVEINGLTIKEFPITTAHLLNRNLAYSGGGYFRLFPYHFIQSQISKAQYTMCYFHINDLITETSKILTKQEYEQYFQEKGTLLNRTKRYVKTNLGKQTAWPKLQRLINNNQFLNLEEADQIIDWKNAPKIILND